MDADNHLHRIGPNGPYFLLRGATSRQLCLIDRDGTLNVENTSGYVSHPDDVTLLGLNLPLLAALSLRMPLVVVTNQGGIAKGLYTPDDVLACHYRLVELLAPHAISLEGIIFCPHHPSIAPCGCRKPLPVILTSALTRYDASTRTSLFIGNTDSDQEASRAARVRYFDIADTRGLQALVSELAPPSH